MKKYGILFFLMACTAILLAQEQVQMDLLVTDSTWKKEVFPFPLNFAPDIPFEGIEEARFPKRWADTTHAECWSYVFVWDIKRLSAITERELEDNLQLYFDGLMGWQHTNALLLKTDDVTDFRKYRGKVKTFDAFFSKKTMTLNVLVEVRYCGQRKKSVVLFRFSPRGFEHEIWHKLNAVTLRSPECEP